jgi:uncharacterized membrane protein YhiD involved in acid resistance
MTFNTAVSHWSLLELIYYFGPRVGFAVLCGGLIGLERELKSKPAGIKTNILICLGSTLYTSVSIMISMSLSEQGHWGDPARIAAQIVSGIGFLGGGTIIQSRGTIQGLTTAATIWVVAALGVCIGLGYPQIAVFSAIVVILVLLAVSIFEDKMLGRSILFSCVVIMEGTGSSARLAISDMLARNELELEDLQLTVRGDQSVATLYYTGSKVGHKKFILELWNVQGVREVRQP